MELLLEGLKHLIEAYGGQYGIVVQLVAILGSVRLVVKPLMTAYESYVASTPDTSDDKRLEDIKASTWYYWLIFMLDWFASIKIKPKVQRRR